MDEGCSAAACPMLPRLKLNQEREFCKLLTCFLPGFYDTSYLAIRHSFVASAVGCHSRGPEPYFTGRTTSVTPTALVPHCIWCRGTVRLWSTKGIIKPYSDWLVTSCPFEGRLFCQTSGAARPSGYVLTRLPPAFICCQLSICSRQKYFSFQ